MSKTITRRNPTGGRRRPPRPPRRQDRREALSLARNAAAGPARRPRSSRAASRRQRPVDPRQVPATTGARWRRPPPSRPSEAAGSTAPARRSGRRARSRGHAAARPPRCSCTGLRYACRSATAAHAIPRCEELHGSRPGLPQVEGGAARRRPPRAARRPRPPARASGAGLPSVEGEQVGALLGADHEQVAEAGGDEKGGPRAASFEQGIGAAGSGEPHRQWWQAALQRGSRQQMGREHRCLDRGAELAGGAGDKGRIRLALEVEPIAPMADDAAPSVSAEPGELAPAGETLRESVEPFDDRDPG